MAESAPDRLPTPSLGRRMACWLYEGMLLFGVVFVAGYLFSSLTQTRHALQNRHALQAFIFVVCGIYFTWFWSKGQTLAMKTWHLRITDRNGQPLTQTRALIRYLLSWLWFLPALAISAALNVTGSAALSVWVLWAGVWMLAARFDPDRQFLHDRIAGTRIVTTLGTGSATGASPTENRPT